MIHRTETSFTKTLPTGAGLYGNFLTSIPQTYFVQTDQEYRVQPSDSTVEALTECSLIFDDIAIEGHSLWVLRHYSTGGQKLLGYVYENGSWVIVDGKGDSP